MRGIGGQYFLERTNDTFGALVIDGQTDHILNEDQIFGEIDVLTVEVEDTVSERLSRLAGVNTGKVHDDTALVNIGFLDLNGLGRGQIERVKVGQYFGGVAPRLYLDVTGHAVSVHDLTGLEKLFLHAKNLRGYKRPVKKTGLICRREFPGDGSQSQISTVTFLFSRLPAAFMSVRISLAIRP